MMVISVTFLSNKLVVENVFKSRHGLQTWSDIRTNQQLEKSVTTLVGHCPMTDHYFLVCIS